MRCRLTTLLIGAVTGLVMLVTVPAASDAAPPGRHYYRHHNLHQRLNRTDDNFLAPPFRVYRHHGPGVRVYRYLGYDADQHGPVHGRPPSFMSDRMVD